MYAFKHRNVRKCCEAPLYDELINNIDKLYTYHVQRGSKREVCTNNCHCCSVLNTFRWAVAIAATIDFN